MTLGIGFPNMPRLEITILLETLHRKLLAAFMAVYTPSLVLWNHA